MPIYEYHCPNCQTTFDMRRPFAEADAPLHCPECESPQVKRLLSRFMISLGRGNGSATAGSAVGGACAACSASSCATCRP